MNYNYLDIANSIPMYLVTLFILLLLLVQAIFFFSLAKSRATELNVDKKVIWKAVKASAVTTIVPSIAIIIGLISLAPVMGIPVSWARLGMAGSMMYELTVAAIGAQTMGATLGGDGYTAQAFANSVWLMTLGVVPGFLYALLFLRRYKQSVRKAVSKDTTLQTLILTTILVSVQVNFIILPVLSGGSPRSAVLIAGCIMAVLTFMIIKFRQNWLKEYALSFSMVAAIIAVILFNV
jgi:hypothetical protein